MRTSVRSRRPWRISSCPAACGIRWVNPSSATTSPSSTSSRTASESATSSAIGASLEREGMPRPALDGHPAQLRELVDHSLPAEPAPTGVLDAAERHLGLVADRLVVDVHDAGVELQRHLEAAILVAGEEARREP